MDCGIKARLAGMPSIPHSPLRILHSAFGASVAGLAPARPGLKGRPLELLCIHGPTKCRVKSAECGMALSCTRGFPTLHYAVCILHLMVPEVGIAPTSPPLQRGANLPQLLGEADKGDRGMNELLDKWINASTPEQMVLARNTKIH